MISDKEILSFVDHTLLKQDAVESDYMELCRDALKCEVSTICVPPSWITFCKKYMESLEVYPLPITTVVGFPNGYNTTESKLFEIEDALKKGASDIDMVINIGKFKSKQEDYVYNELLEARKVCGTNILKVIVETRLLTEQEIIRICEIVEDSGADYIKTSTGFAGGGVTLRDIELFNATIRGNMRIKASGGIKSMGDARAFLNLGVTRLGTSSLVPLYLDSQIHGDY